MRAATVLEARIADLEAEAVSFTSLGGAAQDAGQFAPAVAAMRAAAQRAEEIVMLRATIAGLKIRDPVRRIEHDLVRAEAAADWQAVSALFLKLETARTKAAAEKQAAEDAAKRAKSPREKAEMIGDMLVQLPPKLREIALGRMNLDRTQARVN